MRRGKVLLVRLLKNVLFAENNLEGPPCSIGKGRARFGVPDREY